MFPIELKHISIKRNLLSVYLLLQFLIIKKGERTKKTSFMMCALHVIKM